MKTLTDSWNKLPLVAAIATCCLFLLNMGELGLLPVYHALAEEPPSGAAEQKPDATDYIIGPGDDLEILVWREPDMSRTVRVRPDGKISMPLVDDIQASGTTLHQLKKRITETLASFVEHPSVYVILSENRSKKIYVLGKVNQPGEYGLEKDTTVLQAIALAGGFAEWAKKDDVVIIRRGPSGQVRIEFDYDDVVSGKQIEKNISLRPDDVVIVP